MHLQSFGLVRAVDVDARQVTVVVSTGDLARDSMVIDQRGWNLANYERNPVVLWAHDDRSLPIGRTVESRVEGNALVQTHQFAEHARAQEVFDLVRGGFVNATSVRWQPGKTEHRKIHDPGLGREREVVVFTEGHELLETSYVPIPADANCLVMRADGSAVRPEDFIATPEPGVPAGPSAIHRFLAGLNKEI